MRLGIYHFIKGSLNGQHVNISYKKTVHFERLRNNSQEIPTTRPTEGSQTCDMQIIVKCII